MQITVRILAETIGATIIGNTELLDSVVSQPLTDSRSLVNPSQTVFFAISTDTGDGHRYVHALANKGVAVFVVDRKRNIELMDGCIYLSVDNVRDALVASAKRQRNFLDPSSPVIAITGSRGKTVVKEMLYASMVGEKRVARSPRSYNSSIGVPLSLWQIDCGTDVAVFEAGISNVGEMRMLNQIIRPQIGVFTGLGDEHSRGFKTKEEKMRQKAMLFDGCSHIVYECGDEMAGEILNDCYGDSDTVLIPCHGYAEIVRVVNRIIGLCAPEIIPEPVEGREMAYRTHRKDDTPVFDKRLPGVDDFPD